MPKRLKSVKRSSDTHKMPKRLKNLNRSSDIHIMPKRLKNVNRSSDTLIVIQGRSGWNNLNRSSNMYSVKPKVEDAVLLTQQINTRTMPTRRLKHWTSVSQCSQKYWEKEKSEIRYLWKWQGKFGKVLRRV